MASVLRTIQSPGVEIREFDKSQYSTGIQGSYALVMGYSNSGPVETPIVGIADITTKNSVFGEPTNEAERYFHYACDEVIKNGGTLVATRLPYDTLNVDNIRSLTTIKIGETAAISGAVIHDVIRAGEFFDNYSQIEYVQSDELGKPLLLTGDEYEQITTGQDFPAKFIDKDLLLVNKSKEVYDNNAEGLITLLVDPIDAITVQMLSSNASENDQVVIFNGIKGIKQSDLAVNLSAQIRDTSVSERAAKLFKSIDFTVSGVEIDKTHANYLGMVVCKVHRDNTVQGLYNVQIIEAFVGSVHKNAKDPSTGMSDYLLDIVNANSQYFEMFDNPRNMNKNTVSANLANLTNDSILWVSAELEVIIKMISN